LATQPSSPPVEPPSDIKAVVDKALGGFNRKDSELYSNAFVADAVIVDGMAPYRWTGPNAQGRWFADAERWAHELGVADESIAYDKFIRADVVDAHAYVVLAATLSFAIRGQHARRLGILTFTLVKQGDEWKIESQAWGRLT